MALRAVTYFGVVIPPFKEEKLMAGSKTIRFVIAGNIISKKNNSLATYFLISLHGKKLKTRSITHY